MCVFVSLGVSFLSIPLHYSLHVCVRKRIRAIIRPVSCWNVFVYTWIQACVLLSQCADIHTPAEMQHNDTLTKWTWHRCNSVSVPYEIKEHIPVPTVQTPDPLTEQQQATLHRNKARTTHMHARTSPMTSIPKVIQNICSEKNNNTFTDIKHVFFKEFTSKSKIHTAYFLLPRRAIYQSR